MSFENYTPDIYFCTIRDRVTNVGLGLLAIGLYSRAIFNLSENGNLASKTSIALGLTLVAAPIIREYQDYRLLGKSDIDEEDPGDDQGGGGWDPDDDTPPSVPDSPGGLCIKWVSEVEVYANEENSQLVDA